MFRKYGTVDSSVFKSKAVRSYHRHFTLFCWTGKNTCTIAPSWPADILSVFCNSCVLTRIISFGCRRMRHSADPSAAILKLHELPNVLVPEHFNLNWNVGGNHNEVIEIMLVNFSLFIIIFLHNNEGGGAIEDNCKNATQKRTELKQDKNKYVEPCGRNKHWVCHPSEFS
jgi:hypothetical protein